MEELVDVVDHNNMVVRTVTRSEMRQQRLNHRASYIFIKNKDGKFWVQRRTMSKDYCPGMLDVCTGGVIQSGEDCYEACYRELEEEVGVTGCELRMFGPHQLGHDRDTVVAYIADLVYDGPFVLQESEVVSLELMSAEEILSAREEYTPDSVEALEVYLELTNSES